MRTAWVKDENPWELVAVADYGDFCSKNELFRKKKLAANGRFCLFREGENMIILPGEAFSFPSPGPAAASEPAAGGIGALWAGGRGGRRGV